MISGYWINKDGDKLNVEKMKDRHIKNCINILKKEVSNNSTNYKIRMFRNEEMRRKRIKTVLKLQ